MYPALLEPWLPLSQQAVAWTAVYGLFAILSASCAFMLWRSGASRRSVEADLRNEPAAGLTVSRRIRWVALAFAPSSLMLAVTTFVSTDVAAVPLLWIVPLGLYLLSFVVAFNSKSRYPEGLVDRGFTFLLLPLAFFLIVQAVGPIQLVLPVHIAVFFLAALLCHRALAEDRPTPARLTEFYLWIALGGILGSLFNALVAPLVFTSVLEYPLVLVAVCLLRRPWKPDRKSRPAVMFAVAIAAGVATFAVMGLEIGLDPPNLRFVFLGLPAFLALTVSRTQLPFALAIGFMLLASVFRLDERERCSTSSERSSAVIGCTTTGSDIVLCSMGPRCTGSRAYGRKDGASR